MNDDFKDRIRAAIGKHEARNSEFIGKPKVRKKRETPEDDITRPQVKFFCKQHNIMVFEIQSSTYDRVNKYKSREQHAPIGFPDLCGIGPNGEAIFIELKAPGKRSNLSPAQYIFLLEAINHGAFACATDGIEHLSSLWSKWKSTNKDVLVADLPPRPKSRF